MNKLDILRFAKRTGLFELSRRLTGRGLRILCYHGIWFGDGHYGDRLYMSPATFAERMCQLAHSGYPVLPLDEALDRLDDGSLPPCATAITIDDAWHGSYRHMFPVLAEHDLPATLYVTTYYADKQTPVFNVAVRYMLASARSRVLDLAALGVGFADDGDGEAPTANYKLSDPEQVERALERICEHAERHLDNPRRQALAEALGEQIGVDYRAIVQQRLFHIMAADELSEVARQGFDIQLHTHRHRISRDGTSCIDEEIRENRDWLEPIASEPLRHFCYPGGIFEPDCWPALERLDVKSATTCLHGLNFPGSHPYALARILDGESSHWLEIEAELSGFVELIRRGKRLLRRSPRGA